MSPSQEEADSMLEETVPQLMGMDMDEDAVRGGQSSLIEPAASCSPSTTAVAVVDAAGDSSTRPDTTSKASKRDSLPLALPPRAVSPSKAEAEAVSMGEDQAQGGGLAQADYCKSVDDKV